MTERLNAYYCPACKAYVVTVDRDEGVTPMFLACRAKGDPDDPVNDCRGMSQSMGYPPAESWPIPQEPTWEWYRPEGDELAGMSEGMRDHVERGGLAIRPLQEIAA